VTNSVTRKIFKVGSPNRSKQAENQAVQKMNILIAASRKLIFKTKI